jgi:alpha-N-acetylglucosaminidase
VSFTDSEAVFGAAYRTGEFESLLLDLHQPFVSASFRQGNSQRFAAMRECLTPPMPMKSVSARKRSHLAPVTLDEVYWVRWCRCAASPTVTNLPRHCRLCLLLIGLIAGFSPALLHAQESIAPAQAVLHRLVPKLASQFELVLEPGPRKEDGFRIAGSTGHIEVRAATIPTLLYGVNWYLKYVAHLQVSPNGSQLGAMGLKLPAPDAAIQKRALYPWRYALNENTDGYSTPYWDDDRWQHEIDILALSGTNAVLLERGTDLVLYRTFRDAGYSDAAIRQWITQPAHQNWQLMGNMCCFNEPISLALMERRAQSARHIVAMLRSLGIVPVLPGYFGMVPADFAERHAGAHVIEQGQWGGFDRPGWIDPRDPWFERLAASFYRHQRDLFGDSAVYDMELFQEGGGAGDVPIGSAARAVQLALLRAHPDARWMQMAWQKNPAPELLAAVDTEHMLIVDIEQGRIARDHRDQEFHRVPWLFGGLWQFGGRNTLGAPLYDYAVRLPLLAREPSSRIAGIALFTEGLDTNPFAFDLYMEMAWHEAPVDLANWARDYAWRRYGKPDAHAARTWGILVKTAYGFRADATPLPGDRDAAHDSLFAAEPSLTTTHAATWSSDLLRYDLADLQPALTELLQVAADLRATETYRYDLVDISRQVLANESRRLLPLIRRAYESADMSRFEVLTGEWLRDMRLEDELLRTNEFFLLGRWLAYVPAWASSASELARLNYDARSILTTWGGRKASEDGPLHDYANRDWAGLTASYYLPRWQLYFDTLRQAMRDGTPPQPIDWYAFGDRWNRGVQHFATRPEGDSYGVALAIARVLDLAPAASPVQQRGAN